jgi:hypothetical protein
VRFRFWPKRGLRDIEPEVEVESPPTHIDEARHARALSDAGLRDARRRDPHVRATAGSLRRLRHDNHFAEAMQTVFRERHP